MAQARGKRAHAALTDAFDAAIQRALAQIARAEGDPETAVHEWRKALRIARALVRLAGDFLDEQVAGQIAGRLRAAHHAGSELRDQDVVADALAKAGNDAAALAQKIESERRRQYAHREAVARMSEHADTIEKLPARLDAALPGKIGVRKLADALASSYKRVRRAGRKAERSRQPEAVHRFRRRVKALQHQLELAENLPGLDVGKLRQQSARLAKHLGEITDTLLVERMIVESDAGLGVEAKSRLLDALEAQQAARLDRAFEDAEPLTTVPARRFRRRLLAATAK